MYRLESDDKSTSSRAKLTDYLGEEQNSPQDTNERPEDCKCSPLFTDLSCWPCCREGFETPNPVVQEDHRKRQQPTTTVAQEAGH